MLAPAKAGATCGPEKMGKLLGPTQVYPDFPWRSTRTSLGCRSSGTAAKRAKRLEGLVAIGRASFHCRDDGATGGAISGSE
jgi:hypothetical protein